MALFCNIYFWVNNMKAVTLADGEQSSDVEDEYWVSQVKKSDMAGFVGVEISKKFLDDILNVED